MACSSINFISFVCGENFITNVASMIFFLMYAYFFTMVWCISFHQNKKHSDFLKTIKKKLIHIDLKIVKTLRFRIMLIECVHESSTMLSNLVIS